MIFLSHRGLWKTRNEQNTLRAFNWAWESGFGIETDIRDALGTLVISHDPPVERCVLVEDFFAFYQAREYQVPLALNIKADGLQKPLKELLQKYEIENYFVFDMSVPEALEYLSEDFKVFTRQSEYECRPAFYPEAQGVWIDYFLTDWVGEETLVYHLWYGKQVCLVSPELHGRDHLPFWEELREMTIIKDARLMLCTDYPEEAKDFFND